jgi:hypothetical protein
MQGGLEGCLAAPLAALPACQRWFSARAETRRPAPARQLAATAAIPIAFPLRCGTGSTALLAAGPGGGSGGAMRALDRPSVGLEPPRRLELGDALLVLLKLLSQVQQLCGAAAYSVRSVIPLPCWAIVPAGHRRCICQGLHLSRRRYPHRCPPPPPPNSPVRLVWRCWKR